MQQSQPLNQKSAGIAASQPGGQGRATSAQAADTRHSVESLERSTSADTTRLKDESFSVRSDASSAARTNVGTLVRFAVDLARNSHVDLGSTLESLKLKLDVFRALAFGNTAALSRGWSEVIVQSSGHHPGVVEFIRSRGSIEDSNFAFVMIGVPAADLVPFRERLNALRERFAPKPSEDSPG